MNNLVRKIINRIGFSIRSGIRLFYRQDVDRLRPSSECIDIIIPIIPKDLDIFPLCLEGIRKNVVNNIANIYIVAPLNEQIIKFCEVNRLIFVNENEVLGFSVKDLKFITSKGVDRSGWMFQQFLKLSGNIGTCRHFVTIDSDHILLKKHIFLTKNEKYVFYRSTEFNMSYYKFNNMLLGKKLPPLLSYIGHKMIFDKQELEKLKLYIERSTGRRWYDGIMQMIDRNVASPFSEFEIYGSFLDRKKYISVYWNQKALLKDKLDSLENLCNSYSNYLSVTFPEYLNK